MTVAAQGNPVDPVGGWVAARAEGLLGAFTAGGVLHAADVHVATRIGALGGEHREEVLLALALNVRAVRHGSVRLALADVSSTVVSDEADPERIAAEDLPWPEPAAWLESVRTSPLVRPHVDPKSAAAPTFRGVVRGQGLPTETDPGGVRPLQLWDGDLWLERYWRIESEVALDLLRRAAVLPLVDDDRLTVALDRLWPRPATGTDVDADQRRAARTAVRSSVSILGGGPGTGKTTTVARVLAALRELSSGASLNVALAAPTGKAAARLQEAIAAAAESSSLPDADRGLLQALSASTVHRLIGAYRSSVRPRYRVDNPLPFDVVVVDEASMLSLTLFHRLLQALRPHTRLILVGDPQQLTSIEAGAVLADLSSVGSGSPLASGISRLEVNRRADAHSGLPELAQALRDGDPEAAMDLLRGTDETLSWYEVADDHELPEEAVLRLRQRVLGLNAELISAARTGDATGAIRVLERHRLLCAHRRGPRGVGHWTGQVRRWLVDGNPALPRGFDDRYAGLPLLVTENDYENQLWNGDSGVVVARGDDLVAAFGRGAAPFELPVGRVGHATVLHAMTVHRSQGSEFDEVTVLLPLAESPLATRELLYTAVTRARSRVTIIGSEAAIRSCITRPAQRATGLARRLAGSGDA